MEKSWKIIVEKEWSPWLLASVASTTPVEETRSVFVNLVADFCTDWASNICTGKWVDELTMLAFDYQGQFDVLESTLAACGESSVSAFLWQLAVGLPVEPASALIATMHRSAVHGGNHINLPNFSFSV